MKITRLGQSCLLIEEQRIKILTDPGSYSTTPEDTDISIILITHEHQDHFDLDKLKEIITRNPEVEVITHSAVGMKLTEAGIECKMIASEEKVESKGISIESYGTEHAVIYGSTSPCMNTGFLIGGKLFMPGDALHDIPPVPVEILALPTSGPWMKMSEAIDYAKAVKPQIVFPIHDALYMPEIRESMVPRIIGSAIEAEGIKFVNILPGASYEF